MSSPTPVRKANKTTLAAMTTRRAAIRDQAAVAASEEATGKPSWASDFDTLSSLNGEFQKLVERLAKIRFSGLSPPPEAHSILMRMREIRRNVKEASESLSSWQGRYVETVKVPSTSMTTAQIQLALAQLPNRALGPNPYMSLEHAYQTVAVPPDDWVLQTLQSNPVNQSLVENVLTHVFLNPLLPNMLDRLSRSAVHRKAIPIWSNVERWWKPALASVKANSTLVPMLTLPSMMETSIDKDANPGYPFAVMPSREGSSVPFTTVESVVMRDEGKFFETIRKKAVAAVLKPRTAEPLDDRFWMYAVQSGNVKHIKRTEAEKKPNRLIFSAPLLLRLMGGAISQPFYENWSHPGSLLGSSFAHGDTKHIVATILRTEPDLEKLAKRFELVPIKRPGYAEGLVELHLKDGLLAAPDKVEYDLGMRPEPMEEFARYTEGVLPAVPAGVSESEAKKFAGWKKINKFVHNCDGPRKQVITNHRVVVSMDYGNPSGSPWTTLRNTFIDLASEEATDRAAWHKVNPNRDYEKYNDVSAYGDDSVDWLHGLPDAKLRELWEKRLDAMRDIGWEYKPGTVALTKNLSSLEILGRQIFGYVADGKLIGFVGLRPVDKLWLTMVYPKEAIKKSSGLNPASVRAARLIMLCDEAAFYPEQWQLAQEMFTRNQQLFSVKPVWADRYEDMVFPAVYDGLQRPRALAESLLLHLGVAVATIATRALDSDDSSDLEVDVDEFESVPKPAAAARLPEAKGQKKKEKPKKKKPEVVKLDDSDVDLESF